ncbi:zinc finger protein 43-like isoform X1 [Schistocerca americana]|uniref:zinc finger protein 43-like isoform X1 n=1 Tax=Schistocerca americana TaxID=7009 RepID=UPI001F4F3774|nr:zinc finger protein 43-like isoform X1 [Schistocerca americana]
MPDTVDVPCAAAPYPMAPQAPRKRNDIHQAQVYPFSMNVKEELEEGANKESIEDPLGISWSTDFIKEDPELNLELSVTENIVETSTRYTSDSARLTQCTGGSSGISCEETCHHRLVQDELMIDMEKSSQQFGTNTEDMAVDKNCSVATRYNCSMWEKELYVYSCNFCQQSFPSKYRFIKHVFMHIDGMEPPSYVCKWCGEVFHSNVSLKKHLRMSENYHFSTAGNHEKYGYSDEHQSANFSDSEPDVCVTELNKLNSYKETWKAADKSANDKGNTIMTNDTEETNHYGTLSTTVNVSFQGNLLTANRTHKCDSCGKSFARAGNLKKHGVIHTGKKPHKCESCGKSFAFPSYVKRHALFHTGKKLNKCHICGKSFFVLWDLKKHLLTHNGKKPHKCEICGKCFVLSSGLKTHVLLHTEKNPHKCGICGQSFAGAGNLKKHSLIHTGEKPHKCEICDKSFTQSANLKTHTLIHSGKKPHKCDICGKFFALSTYLKKHGFIHTGKKPHKCEICGKSFAFSRDLKRHLLIHTGKKLNKCDIYG